MPKAEMMEKIAVQVRSCVKCRLWKGRKKAVPGEGNVNAKVVFVGEGPGYWENIRGLPFVGAAGKILDGLLESIGLRRDMVFITNVVKCRPPGNRDPKPDEIEICTALHLERQIRLIHPALVACLGRHSTRYVLSKVGFEKVVSITEFRGKTYKVSFLGFPLVVVPMYHPASVLRNPKYRDELESDFQLLKMLLQKRRII